MSNVDENEARCVGFVPPRVDHSEADLDALRATRRLLKKREEILVAILATLLQPDNRSKLPPKLVEMAWNWVQWAGLEDAFQRETIEPKEKGS